MSAFIQIGLVSVLPLLAILAAGLDLTSYTIPNWISLTLAGAFGLLAATAGLPVGALEGHALAGAAALVAGMGLFAFGWIGGGDAKLLAACCLWFGWPDAQAFLLDTALAGGAFAFFLLVMRGQMVRPFIPDLSAGPDFSAWIGRLITPGESAPYGVAIALGALIAFPSSQLIRFVHLSY
ncbi:MAG: prepilin peptidase [Caulobacteraceae bacterium]